MRKLIVILMAVGIFLGLSGTALAGNTAEQTVTYEVTAINELSTSGNPGALIVNSATAGSQPNEVKDTSTTYAITTNCKKNAKKITAAIDSAMPKKTTLKITLAAPTGGTTKGQKTLSTSAVNVVTGIDAVASSGHQITYDFSATAAAGVVASNTRTVTLTLTDS